MKRMKPVDRQEVLRQMMALAAGSANDVVKLAYLSDERMEEIDRLQLGCLTEFKRSGNGTVEVKLADRAAVLEKLLEQLKEDRASAPAAFLQALDQPAPSQQEAPASDAHP
ncbi:MAG: XRE family transcriptional regulator [Evtepia sp.]|uniref:XRE family transcriptional regulator n=1 Tax=Evtepia sp. TaxID=2773933 RepID=UPI002A7489D9|nr:XRE family transcriptional regulator [Evtepia sp.]MDY3014872.1 XRE family transcriptional regulator [Evtepia sp.]